MIDIDLPWSDSNLGATCFADVGWPTRLTWVGKVRPEISRSSLDPGWICTPAPRVVFLWFAFCHCFVRVMFQCVTVRWHVFSRARLPQADERLLACVGALDPCSGIDDAPSVCPYQLSRAYCPCCCWFSV
jgi:hypothetical protein